MPAASRLGAQIVLVAVTAALTWSVVAPAAPVAAQPYVVSEVALRAAPVARVAVRSMAIPEPTPASPPEPTPKPPPEPTVEEHLRDAAAEFGIPEQADTLVAVASCESGGFRADVLDGRTSGAAGEQGVLQFLPSTWRPNAARLGYTPDDILDPRAQARVTAFMWQRRQQWQWTCHSIVRRR